MRSSTARARGPATTITAVDDQHGGGSNPAHAAVCHFHGDREPIHMLRNFSARRELRPAALCSPTLSKAAPLQTAQPLEAAHQPPGGMRSSTQWMRPCALTDTLPWPLSQLLAAVKRQRLKVARSAIEREDTAWRIHFLLVIYCVKGVLQP